MPCSASWQRKLTATRRHNYVSKAQISAFFHSIRKSATVETRYQQFEETSVKWSVLLCFAFSVSVFAQQQQKCPPRETYKSLRFDEDWSALRDAQCRTDS